MPWYLPTGEPIRKRSSPEVNSHGRGLLEIRARVNPGAPGWTWARILDSDLEVWEERAVAAGTRERVGWSAEPAEQFYFQAAFPVPRGKRFSGSVELWFQADAGGPPIRLDATPITIPKR
ncbi:MAG: hypothetical protein JRJ84_24220 [Deltaproteobacteria bacterium]|nr:hypothetical protein [Deltaproteobacteria bacterium]